MNEQLKEQLSAFIDDELADNEAQLLVRQLAADPALRAQADKIWAVGRSLRGESSALNSGSGMRARIMAAIDDEPALAMPAQPESGRVESNRWGKMLGGGAIAAAVAVLAINLLPQGAVDPADSLTTTQAASETPPPNLVTEPVEYTVPRTINDAGLVSADPELAAYFLRHSVGRPSLTPGSGRARMLSEDAATAVDPVKLVPVTNGEVSEQ